MDLDRIQQEVRKARADGWLLCDFHNRDRLACHILGLDPNKFTSRRWFYYIPAEGEPTRLVSRVEPAKLDSLPGRKEMYLSWRELHAGLQSILGSPGKIAMQYSPLNHIPYVSIVDAGTVELVRSFGHEVVSSANLVQTFEAVIDDAGYQSHLRAGEKIQRISVVQGIQLKWTKRRFFHSAPLLVAQHPGPTFRPMVKARVLISMVFFGTRR